MERRGWTDSMGQPAENLAAERWIPPDQAGDAGRRALRPRDDVHRRRQGIAMIVERADDTNGGPR